jgi:glycerophosphoryl diester phosphodiesterase
MTEIVAHRGGALLWPENGRSACEGSVALGVEQLQVDIHPSRDGRIVVIHDATLDRTTDGTGPVADQDWAALSQLTLKGSASERILLLEEVIEILRPGRTKLRLEVKPDTAKRPYPGFPAQIAAMLEAHDFLPRTIVTGFQAETVTELAALAPPRLHAWLVSADMVTASGLDAIIAAAQARAIPAIGLRWSLLDEAIRAQLRASGLTLCAFGCNDEKAIAAALALCVDELMTDRPDIAIQQPAS